jgi:hypothetical protein
MFAPKIILKICNDHNFNGYDFIIMYRSIGCSFKFLLKVSVEESIVTVPRITDHELAVYI